MSDKVKWRDAKPLRERIEELEAENARLETEARLQAEEIAKTRRRADKWGGMVMDCLAAGLADEIKLAKALEALEKLARLGNGDLYGNSEGNMIARATLAELTGEQP
jgi:predicted nuclease with TOPRIM domain